MHEPEQFSQAVEVDKSHVVFLTKLSFKPLLEPVVKEPVRFISKAQKHSKSRFAERLLPRQRERVRDHAGQNALPSRLCLFKRTGRRWHQRQVILFVHDTRNGVIVRRLAILSIRADDVARVNESELERTKQAGGTEQLHRG